MPVVSQAQRRAMYAAKEGHSTLGIPKKVGEEFIDASHGVKNLPARKHHDGGHPGRIERLRSKR